MKRENPETVVEKGHSFDLNVLRIAEHGHHLPNPGASLCRIHSVIPILQTKNIAQLIIHQHMSNYI